MKKQSKTEDLRCSFCNRNTDEVERLITGPNVYICNECVIMCNGILSEELNKSTLSDIDPLPLPTDIKEGLDKYVIGQEQAKKVLSVAVHNLCFGSHRSRIIKTSSKYKFNRCLTGTRNGIIIWNQSPVNS